MDIHNEFIAQEKNLVFYAGKPILNKVHSFYDINGDAWSFALATGYTFKIWEEREGGLLVIDWDDSNITNNSDNTLTLNATAEDTDIDIGRYYYEIAYIVSGGYPVLIGYGQAKFI